MSHTLIISDRLYDRLEQAAKRRGLTTVEQLLEDWQARDEELLHRQKLITQIDSVRKRLSSKYGTMPDSVVLVQEDRDR